MYKVQIYARQKARDVAAVQPGEVDMLDFENIGGVYNDSGSAVANAAALNAYLADAGETAPAIRFGGPIHSYASGQVARKPGRAYFGGSIDIPADKPVIIDGGNSRLSFTGLPSATTPAFIVRSGAASVRRLIRDFDLDTNGSGLRLISPGKGTIIERIRVGAATGVNDPSTGAGTVSLDDMSDLDTAAYGFKIEDSDGFTMRDCSVISPGDHGILVKGRLQDGVVSSRIWGAKAGSGFKGENINGSQLDIVSESCYGFGVHLSRCGVPVYDGSTMHIARSRPNAIDIWTEANNGRGTSVTGSRTVQSFFDMCGTLVVGGSNSWGDNKIKMSEGTRNSSQFVQDLHITQSVQPMYDLNQEDPANPTFTLPSASSQPANNNFPTAWPTGEVGVTIQGTQGSTNLLLTFPANSFNGITALTAYWRPWGLLTNFSPQIGDTYIMEMEIQGDSNAVDWCNANQNSNCNITVPVIGPFAGPGDAKELGIFNTQSRRVLSKVVLAATGSGIYATPALTWDPGLPNNAAAMTLTIRSLKFYGIRANGGKIPQS